MKTADKISYLNYLFEQVRLQQEVRDRWFRYYMTTVGAVSLVGLTAVQLFLDRGFDPSLFAFLAILSLGTFLISICFFMIYLRQRRNYLRFYKIMGALERETLSTLYEKVYPAPLQIHKYGADFFTVWIHIIISATYLGLTFIMALLAFKVKLSILTLGGAIGLSVASMGGFEIVRRKNFLI